MYRWTFFRYLLTSFWAASSSFFCLSASASVLSSGKYSSLSNLTRFGRCINTSNLYSSSSAIEHSGVKYHFQRHTNTEYFLPEQFSVMGKQNNFQLIVHKLFCTSGNAQLRRAWHYLLTSGPANWANIWVSCTLLHLRFDFLWKRRIN